MHCAQVDALGDYDGCFAGGACGRVARVFLCEGACGELWDGLDFGVAAGVFDEVEHD